MSHKIVSNVKVDVEIQFTLNEEEAQALVAIVGYGADSFLNVFYEKMGKAYLKPHEKGLRSLFEFVYAELPSKIHAAEKARLILKKEGKP